VVLEPVQFPAYTGWGECVNSSPSDIPRVIQRQQGRSSLAVFLDLYRHSDRNGRLELDARAVSERTGFSRKTVYRVVRFLQRVNLLFLEEQRAGRGRHSRYRLNWQKPRDGRSRRKCHPHKYGTSNGNTAFKDTPVSPKAFQHQRPTGFAGRQATLDRLPGHVVLVKGARYWRYCLERIRTGAWQLGADRATSDVIAGTLSARVTGRTLAEYRVIAAELNRRGAELVECVRRAWRRGRRAAYAACKAALVRLFKGAPIQDPPKQGRRSTESWDRGYDLSTPDGRRRYLNAARELARSGAPCPRCGERLDRRLFRDDAAIAFREDGLCQCVYVAFDRAALAREERARQETAGRWTLAGPLGGREVREGPRGPRAKASQWTFDPAQSDTHRALSSMRRCWARRTPYRA